MEGRNIEPSARFCPLDDDMKPPCSIFKQEDEMTLSVFKNLTICEDIGERLERFD